MTPEFRLLMRLVSSGATGSPVPPDPAWDAVDWWRLFCLAQEQSVVSLAACGLDLSPELACPEEIRKHYQSVMLGSAVKNMIKKEAVLNLIRQMEEAGIPATLIKGYAVADCYHAPECRLSADTDLWIDPKQERQACELLESLGFRVEPRWKNGHHAVCRHPVMGCVELHVQLYDEIIEEIWFGSMTDNDFVQEPRLRVESPDGSFTTLGHTDHLLFLMLHLMKHFIISGMNLRMMLDVALYLKRHCGDIDWSRITAILDQFRYSDLLNHILWSLQSCGGLDLRQVPGLSATCPPHLDAVLTDLEIGGALGCKNQKAREEGWYAYTRQVYLQKKSPLQYKLYMIWWKADLYRKALFPTREQLGKRYPIVLKWAWTIPFVWVYRLFARGFRFLFGGAAGAMIVNDEAELDAAGAERLALFRKLDMIE